MSIRKNVKKIIPKSIRKRFGRHSALMRRNTEETLSRHPDLVTVGNGTSQKLASIESEFTATGTAVNNLEIVVKALKRSKVSYFMVPGFAHQRYRIGIRDTDKDLFLRAMIDMYSHTGLYVSTAFSRGETEKKAMLIAPSIIEKLQDSDLYRVYRYIAAETGEVFGNSQFGVDIEIWTNGSNLDSADEATRNLLQGLGISIFDGFDFTGSLIAPRGNKVTSLLPKSEQKKVHTIIGGKKYTTFEVFSQTYMDDIVFPIDIVYTWVDGSDPIWRKNFTKYRSGTEGNTRNNSNSRYVSHDELKYSLRSLHMYGRSFIRNIYIVTDGQVPEWLDTNTPGVKIIDHKDIFADKDALPVFNSHAISSQVHRIPGLSERYILFNDDVFLGKPANAELFFSPGGIAKIVQSKAQFGVGPASASESAPSSAGKNVRSLLCESQGRYITNKFAHTAIPQIKEVSNELAIQYKDALDHTMRSKFRSPDDISFATGLHHNHAFLTGRAVTTRYRLAVVNISHQEAAEKLEKILTKRDCYVFCLNDTNTPDERMNDVADMMQSFLDRYFPFPSPWEKR